MRADFHPGNRVFVAAAGSRCGVSKAEPTGAAALHERLYQWLKK
jgi:hypothetical protein